MTEMRAIPQQAFDIVDAWEETCLFAYDDRHFPPKEAAPGAHIDGTLTAGTGHTGSDVTIGMTVTAEMDHAWKLADLEDAARKLYAKIGAVVDDLTVNQYAAMLDFVFCLGNGDPKKPEWTIWKRLRARAFDQVPLEIQKFVNWGDPPVKSSGLVRRRNAETELWAVNEPGSIDVPLPASITRATPTPPTKADPVPVTKSKALILGGAGAIAGAGPMVNQVSQAIQPYAQMSHYVQGMLGVLATVAAGCAAVGLFYIWMQKRNAQN
jgi:lysozyme